jgi:hypothetical protein
MPGLPTPQNQEGQTRRTIGSLFRSEEWWRDQYDDIYNRGYQLRPRYHPSWEPSWIRSGRDFFTVEDGQPSTVRTLFSRFINPNKLHCISYALRWMLHADRMASKSCLRRSTPRKDHMNRSLHSYSRRGSLLRILVIIVCPCWTLLRSLIMARSCWLCHFCAPSKTLVSKHLASS